MDVSQTKCFADVRQLMQFLSPDVYFGLGRAGFLPVPEESVSAAYVDTEEGSPHARISVLDERAQGITLRDNRFSHTLTCSTLVLRTTTPLARGAVVATDSVLIDVPDRHALDVLHPGLSYLSLTSWARTCEFTFEEVLNRLGSKTKMIEFQSDTFSDECRMEDLLIAWAEKFEDAPKTILKINTYGPFEATDFLMEHSSAILDERFRFSVLLEVPAVGSARRMPSFSWLECNGWKSIPLGNDPPRVGECYPPTLTIHVEGCYEASKRFVKPGFNLQN